jgi:hypothetical protein
MKFARTVAHALQITDAGLKAIRADKAEDRLGCPRVWTKKKPRDVNQPRWSVYAPPQRKICAFARRYLFSISTPT